MDYAEDGVGAKKVPRVDRCATSGRVTGKFLRVDRGRGAICSAVQFGVIEIDALVVVSRCSNWRRAGCAWRRSQAGAGGNLRSIERAVKGYIVVNSGCSRRAAGDQRHKSGSRVRRL